MIANDCSKELIALATGPNSVVRRFSGFSINGYVFHTKDREKHRKCQNSGIMVEADGQAYFGRLSDIVEVDYYGSHSVVLFRCDWVDVKSPRGIKKDSNGTILVSFSRLIHTGKYLRDDPFVFSSQVKQVFYVQDPTNADWHQVVKMNPRDTFDMGKPQDGGGDDDDDDDDDGSRQCMPYDALFVVRVNLLIN